MVPDVMNRTGIPPWHCRGIDQKGQSPDVSRRETAPSVAGSTRGHRGAVEEGRREGVVLEVNKQLDVQHCSKP
jgi:hypothetical protein